MLELCIDCGLILLAYGVIAVVTAWVVIAIIRGGYVDDHSEPDHSRSEE